MDQPAAANTPAPIVPPPAPQVVTSSSGNSSKKGLLMLIVGLLIGLAAGVLVYKTFLSKPQNMAMAPSETTITVPSDAVPIQSCSDHRGKLYVKPGDIPVDPVYMVNDGKVIGIEFMLAKDEFLSGKSFKDLSGLGMKVDHVNIGLLSSGHEGYPVPHYHVDIYNVPKSVEDGITCPGSTTTTNATPSATVSPAASSSATPTP